jgi:hypothetical protein
MTDEEIMQRGSKLAVKTINFLIKETKNTKWDSLADKDGVILVALIRIVISKIIHRCRTEDEANIVFHEFVEALGSSWSTYDFEEERKPLH